MPNFAAAAVTFLLLFNALLLIGLQANRKLLAQPSLLLLNPYLTVFFAAASGYVLFGLLLFGLGLVNWLSPLPVVVGLIVLLALLYHRSLLTIDTLLKAFGRLELGLLIIAFICYFLLAVRVPGNSDDTMYHLPLALGYAEHGSLYVSQYIRFPLFPQFANLLMSLGFIFLGKEQGVFVAQAFMAMPVLLMWMGIVGLVEAKLGKRWPAYFALPLLVTLAPLKNTLGYAYIDQTLALFCFAMSAVFIAMYLESEQKTLNKRWYYLAGIFAGGAIGTKYFGGVYVAVAYLAILLFGRDVWAVVRSGMTALMVGGGWYLRAWLVSGDPIHPAGGTIFGYYLWNAQDLLNQKLEQATFGTKRVLQQMPSAVVLAGMRSMLLAPFSVYRWRQCNAGEKAGMLSILLYFLFWFVYTQVYRYLGLISGIGIYLLCLMLADSVSLIAKRSNSGWLNHRQIAKLLPTLLLLIAVGNLLHKTVKQFQLERQQWTEILHSRVGYDLLVFANTQTAVYGHGLMNLNFEDVTFFFNGVVYGQVFGPARYSQLGDCTRPGCPLLSSAALKRYMLSFHSRMIALPLAAIPDISAYEDHFTVLYRSPNGYLLGLKP
ncbi:glycosyltransferase family 39 protein [Neisseriaceae bacterium TC5R-5]|nr:glycosyltransferase family 39 protein [Neisseriaceae bacterium TC5R-5]